MSTIFYQPEEFEQLLQATREVCQASLTINPTEVLPLWLVEQHHVDRSREWLSFCETISALPEFQPFKPDVSWLFALWCWWGTLKEANCVPEITARLVQMGEIVIPLLVQNPAAWFKDNRLQRLCLDRFIFHLQTWYFMPGRHAEKFIQRLDEVASALKSESITIKMLGLTINKFNGLCDKDLARAEMLAKRLQISELGNIKAAHAEIFVNQFYNKTVANHPLPECVAQFIEMMLVPALQYYVITEGEKSVKWSFWSSQIQLIVWSLKPYKTPEETQSFFEKSPALISKLEEAEAPSNCTAEQFQNFVENMSGCIVELLKGKELSYVTLNARQISEEATITSHLQSGKISDEYCFSIGDWVQFFDENNCEIRCQFQMQAAGTDQLLFVNRQGQKVLQKSMQAMQACLDAGIAKRIPESAVFSASISASVARLQHLCGIETKRTAQKRKAEEQLQEQQIEQELIRRKVQEAQKQAQLKAEHEAKRIEQEREKAKALAVQELRVKQKRQDELNAEKIVSALTLGTWAYISFDAKKPVRCKLAVRLASTGRHVFVDRVGSKIAELNYTQLVAMYVEGSVTFQAPEQNFETRLEGIVRGLRKTDNKR